MAAIIVNAAPMVIQYGTQDLSTRSVPRELEAIPQHLPKFYLFAEKGPLTPQLVSGSERDSTYGSNTFDLRGKYANHATVFANLVNAEGNACMIERVIPAGAGPESNIVLSLDVLPTKVDLYERNTDGSIKLDALSSPILAKDASGTPLTADGFKAKWVLSHRASAADMQDFGQATILPGNQIDSTNGTQSVRYPIFELKASSQGAYGNNIGIRLSAPTVKTTAAMPTKLMAEERVYPYFFSMIRRTSDKTSPKTVETIFGEQSIMLSVKPGVIDPLTEKQVYIGDVLLDSYQNLTDLRYPALFGDFGSLAVYEDNIATVLALFHDAEIPYIDGWSDFSDREEDHHLFNFVTGMSSQGVPYHSFQLVDDSDGIRLSEYANVFAKGGSDGTMNDEAFASLVSERVVGYQDPNSPLQELAVNVESIIYDSGFPLETKYDLISFIAQRKDTFVVLATHVVGERDLTGAEEHSLAVALRTRLQMYPESDYFGTPVMRGMVVGRSAKLRNSLYTKRLPLTAEVAVKAARYMGAGNGRWKNGYNFDQAPGSVVDLMSDISITWVPAAVRNRNWDVGLNWVQAYDRRSYFFPALKTVYNDDTSVLNSFFTALAIGQLNKVSHAAWREFTGTSSLTNSQLAKRVNEFVVSRTQGRFDNRFIVEPDAFFTDMDLLRGFSFTLPIRIYAPSMKTVMTTYVQAYRIDDYAATA